MKFTWLACLLPLGLLAAACAGSADRPPSAAAELTEVRLLMGFRPDIQFSPFYVAIERGYFEGAGLEINIEHMPENEALALVAAGEAPFSIASGEQVLLSRAQGLPLVYVMAWWQDYPVAIASPVDSDIQDPEDLVGKRVGIPGLYGASYIGYRALMDAAGVDESRVELDSIEYTQVQALLAGREDAVVIYANNEPIQLESQGLPVRVIKVSDYVHLASNGLVTNEALLGQDPDLVERMIGAILRGVEDVIADPEAAYEISKGFVEGLEQADRQVLGTVLEKSVEFWKAERLGYSDPESWVNMQNVLLKMDLLSEPLELEAAYSNQFIP